MLPISKLKNLIDKHKDLEKELSSGQMDKKFFAEKSKEYSELNEVIDFAKEYLSYENNLKDLKDIGNLMFKVTNDKKYKECVEKQEIKIKDNSNIPSNIVINSMTKDKISFYEYCMKNIWKQKKYFNSIDIDKNFIKKLELEKIKSLEEKKILEENSGESYEEYIKKYFLD